MIFAFLLKLAHLKPPRESDRPNQALGKGYGLLGKVLLLNCLCTKSLARPTFVACHLSLSLMLPITQLQVFNLKISSWSKTTAAVEKNMNTLMLKMSQIRLLQ